MKLSQNNRRDATFLLLLEKLLHLGEIKRIFSALNVAVTKNEVKKINLYSKITLLLF